jgi:pyruvate formate lyase activating enzyme
MSTKETETVGIIFNIQRFSIQDGPGIRTTVFLKGCPLRCLWCSNPESQNFFPEVVHSDFLCNSCGLCIEICELQAISFSHKGKGVKINRKICNRCGKCVETCIPKAIKFYGKEMNVEEVFQEIARDKPFYQDSGGGVTVSGGEPLSQPDFVTELFKQCQGVNIHTCIETSGYADSGAWEKVLPHTDLLLFDMKLINSSEHLRVTGKSNDKILNNLRLVATTGVPVIIRIPVIPSINNSEESITDIARYVAGLNGLREVNLMPYHRLGVGKYKMLDRRYNLSTLTPLEESQLEGLVNIVKSFNLGCEIII